MGGFPDKDKTMTRSFTRYIKVYLISPDTGLLSSILIQRTAFMDHTRR